jgi:hypothetical protein
MQELQKSANFSVLVHVIWELIIEISGLGMKFYKIIHSYEYANVLRLLEFL